MDHHAHQLRKKLVLANTVQSTQRRGWCRGKSTRTDAPWPPRAYSWYVVGVLSLAYTVSFIDRQVLNVVVEPIRHDLQITDTQISLLQGFAFAIFYSLMGVPIARLADRGKRRNIIAAGIALWCLMTAACGLVRNFLQLFVARIGVGVGEAALSPPAGRRPTDRPVSACLNSGIS